MGLVKFNIPEAKVIEEVYFRKDVVLSSVRFDEKNGDISAYLFTDDINHIKYTDTFLQKITQKANQLLPGGNISIIDYNKEKKVYTLGSMI